MSRKGSLIQSLKGSPLQGSPASLSNAHNKSPTTPSIKLIALAIMYLPHTGP